MNYSIITSFFQIFFPSVNIYNLNFPKIIGNHNKKGLDINSLTSYKFTDNFRIDTRVYKKSKKQAPWLRKTVGLIKNLFSPEYTFQVVTC